MPKRSVGSATGIAQEPQAEFNIGQSVPLLLAQFGLGVSRHILAPVFGDIVSKETSLDVIVSITYHNIIKTIMCSTNKEVSNVQWR